MSVGNGRQDGKRVCQFGLPNGVKSLMRRSRAVPFHALDFLRWLTFSRHRDLIIGRLVELLSTLDEIVVGEVADHLLHVAFHWEEFGLPPQVARENLNAEQRAVLHAIAARDHL